MALTVKDIMELDGLKSLNLIAGEGGTNRYVASLGIADYEFSSFSQEEDKAVFEQDMIILSTLLFAKENPRLILSTVEYLHEIGAAAFVCKTTLFPELPREVIDFSNQNNFPVIQYGPELYMESVIFEILDAIRAEDDNFFSEANISSMIRNELSKPQVYTLSKNISLSFKKYAMAIYLKSESETFRINLERYTRVFYLNRSLINKALLYKYKDGLFAILTARQDSEKTFEIILEELLEFLTPTKEGLFIGCSRIHEAYENLDQCIRESYYTYIASAAEQREFHNYDSIGSYQILTPLMESAVMKEFMTSHMQPILKKTDFYETMRQLVLNEGDIFRTAASLNCHHNTIRYRISKAKQFLHCEEMSDQDFYADISLAVRLYMLYEYSRD